MPMLTGLTAHQTWCGACGLWWWCPRWTTEELRQRHGGVLHDGPCVVTSGSESRLESQVLTTFLEYHLALSRSITSSDAALGISTRVR
jgi:hypothetical protein